MTDKRNLALLRMVMSCTTDPKALAAAITMWLNMCPRPVPPKMKDIPRFNVEPQFDGQVNLSKMPANMAESIAEVVTSDNLLQQVVKDRRLGVRAALNRNVLMPASTLVEHFDFNNPQSWPRLRTLPLEKAKQVDIAMFSSGISDWPSHSARQHLLAPHLSRWGEVIAGRGPDEVPLPPLNYDDALSGTFAAIKDHLNPKQQVTLGSELLGESTKPRLSLADGEALMDLPLDTQELLGLNLRSSWRYARGIPDKPSMDQDTAELILRRAASQELAYLAATRCPLDTERVTRLIDELPPDRVVLLWVSPDQLTSQSVRTYAEKIMQAGESNQHWLVQSASNRWVGGGVILFGDQRAQALVRDNLTPDEVYRLVQQVLSKSPALFTEPATHLGRAIVHGDLGSLDTDRSLRLLEQIARASATPMDTMLAKISAGKELWRQYLRGLSARDRIPWVSSTQAINYLQDELSPYPGAWDMYLQMATDWDGTLGDLIETVQALVA